MSFFRIHLGCVTHYDQELKLSISALLLLISSFDNNETGDDDDDVTSLLSRQSWMNLPLGYGAPSAEKCLTRSRQQFIRLKFT